MTDAERTAVEFTFAGAPVRAWSGDTVAMALWAAGHLALRRSSRDGAARGVFCSMGVCYDCLVRVDGETLRACTTLVRAGMLVEPGGKP
ncbi:MAG: (2Fe-2S)-binding protein [Planctomycetes bacterium]|nr:(2Fe-2S)-binding protein [Planctomycetota bacterium]